MNAPSKTQTDPQDAPWLDLVRSKVDALRYGTVQILIHDGRVTQVECTDKTRFDKEPGDIRPT